MHQIMQSEQSTAIDLILRTRSSFQFTAEPVQERQKLIYLASEDLTHSLRQILLDLHFQDTE